MNRTSFQSLLVLEEILTFLVSNEYNPVGTIHLPIDWTRTCKQTIYLPNSLNFLSLKKFHWKISTYRTVENFLMKPTATRQFIEIHSNLLQIT